MKKYLVNGTVYTFDSKGKDYETMTLKGMVYLADCRENGKEAWVDANGVQFIGERRVQAKEIPINNQSVPYGYSFWGGELRNILPHGCRYYMNKHR